PRHRGRPLAAMRPHAARSITARPSAVASRPTVCLSRDSKSFTDMASAISHQVLRRSADFLERWLRSDRHDGSPARAKLGLDLVLQLAGLGFGADDGESGRATPGHQSRGHALRAKQFLKERQQRVFFQRGRFEGVIELAAGRCEVGGSKELDEFARPAWLAIERRRKASQLLIRPRRSYAESGVNEQERGASQSGERRQRLDTFTPSRRQRWLVLEKKRAIGAEPRSDVVKLAGGKR